MRIGQGYDIHIFDKERPLIIGGLKIRDENGLLGHSDADVLIHAIMDALLGAAGFRDIGYYFPDNDEKFKGIDSKILLKEVAHMIEKEGYFISNIDTTIVCEKPKLKDYIPKMQSIIADVLKISVNQISIKATTNEKQDSVGNEKAIQAFAICLLEVRNDNE